MCELLSRERESFTRTARAQEKLPPQLPAEMEIGHTSLTAEPRLVRNSAAQWRCDLVPARRQTDSCAALGSLV